MCIWIQVPAEAPQLVTGSCELPYAGARDRPHSGPLPERYVLLLSHLSSPLYLLFENSVNSFPGSERSLLNWEVASVRCSGR